MGFYIDWKAKMQSGESVYKFVDEFIKSYHPSVESLKIDDEAELEAAYYVLHETALSVFIDVLKELKELPGLSPQDVPCFSNMENGASRLNELLSFAPNGLTFSEAGYQLMDSIEAAAQKKYGENQSKLAAIMSLVELSNTRPIVVRPTAWGNYLTRYSFSEKKPVLKKLLLRDACVQNILCCALHGPVSYRDIVAFLSDSTKKRRRTNVKYLINFILSDTEYEISMSNIDWEV